MFRIFEFGLIIRCNLTLKNFEIGLIAVQIDFQNFRAWPYCDANRLGLIAVHQCTFEDSENYEFRLRSAEVTTKSYRASLTSAVNLGAIEYKLKRYM